MRLNWVANRGSRVAKLTSNSSWYRENLKSKVIIDIKQFNFVRSGLAQSLASIYIVALCMRHGQMETYWSHNTEGNDWLLVAPRTVGHHDILLSSNRIIFHLFLDNMLHSFVISSRNVSSLAQHSTQCFFMALSLSCWALSGVSEWPYRVLYYPSTSSAWASAAAGRMSLCVGLGVKVQTQYIIG